MFEDHSRNLIVSLMVFLIVLFGFAFAFNQIEGWNMTDSVYFVVVSATTIGYGDLTPNTNTGKILTIFFSFIGIAFAFYYVSLISSYVFQRHLGRKKIGEYTPHTYRKSGPKTKSKKKSKRSKSNKSSGRKSKR